MGDKKICSKCFLEKSLDDFSFKSVKNNKKQSHCKDCRSEIQRNYYQKNKEYYLHKSKTEKEYIKNYVLDRKKNMPCKDCGKLYPHYVMDFDHLDGEDKLFCIGLAVRFGILKVKAEIDKCELVCSNCHRIRTYNRQHGVVNE